MSIEESPIFTAGIIDAKTVGEVEIPTLTAYLDKTSMLSVQ
jgi:hypothetical protein